MWACCTQNDNQGCILADEMGLGKVRDQATAVAVCTSCAAEISTVPSQTLQSIALIWTMLKQPGRETLPNGSGLIEKACVVCPSSLCQNWAKEFKQWLGPSNISPLVITPGPGTKSSIAIFLFGKQHDVIIISYELYRKHASQLNVPKVGLLVCDEGHRLKNSSSNKTIQALNGKQR
eukprot:SAG31_NODE_497_length_14862_cov_6.951568_12_plen_177_part_00